MKKLIIGAGVAIAALAALVILDPFYQVNSGYVGVLLNFGSVQNTVLEPGLHFAVPFYQDVERITIQPQTASTDETASTHDLQNVTTSIAVTYSITSDQAVYFYSTFRDFDTAQARVVAPAVSNDVKAVTAKYDAEELVTKRDIVDAEIKDQIVASLAPYHLTVDAVNVSNFAFSDAYTQAIEQKQVAQQQALQAQYTLQQAQINSQQAVVTAKAQADAAVETATGDAQATILRAQAQAKANNLIDASLTANILQLNSIKEWDGRMPTYLSSGAPLPFIGSATK